eukprot:NODE_484_length_6933_cov_0.508341.p6 type:complete len:173 gc:universal NODE_484_length_6933_cov_0.508341:3637-4155(+)
MQQFRRTAPYVGPILLFSFYCKENFHFVKVQGMSMHPNIDHGDYLLGYKCNIEYLENGDVILLRSPQNGTLQVKRLVSKKLVIPDPDSKFYVGPGEGLLLPKGTVWVEGDFNRTSQDSNYYGPLVSSAILGKLVYKVNKFEKLKKQNERYSKRLTLFSGKFIEHPWWWYYNI